MKNSQENSKKKPFYKKWWVWVIAVLFLIIITSGGGEPENNTTSSIPVIEYTSLREWNPNEDPSAIGLEIFIKPEEATKENIIALAEKFNTESDKVFVKFYQSKEAWDAEQSETYGNIYHRDYLAVYTKNTNSQGVFNEIKWLQEEGQFQDLFGTTSKIEN